MNIPAVVRSSARRRLALSALTMFALTSCLVDEQADVVSETDSELHQASGTAWLGGRVHVCWENPSQATSIAQEWVKRAIKTSWEKSGVCDLYGLKCH